ncbi:MAG: hypothetical protein AAF738_00225 [Bacteroidota bacterium]
MKQQDNLLAVVQTLLSYLRYIVAVCTIVAVGSVIIVLLLPVYYKSSTTFLAVNPDLLTERGLFGTTTRDPQPYGDNNDNDRLINIARSAELANYLIETFDLYQHYAIDTSKARAAYDIRLKLAKLYDVQRTKLDAIELTVEDKNPELAAAMAKAARKKVDAISLEMLHQVQQSQIMTLQTSMQEKERLLATLSDTIQVIRQRYGVYNIESQSESLASLLSASKARLARTEGRLDTYKQGGFKRDSIRYLNANVQGIRSEVAALEQQMATFNKGMSQVQALEEEYEQAAKQNTYQKEQLKKLNTAYNSSQSAIILLDEAAIPVVKSRPVRSVLVIAAVLAAFIFSLVGVLLFDQYKDVDWKVTPSS